jgi:hypothetical protein
MARIRKYDLAPELADTLVRLLGAMPDEQITAYGRNCLPGGFTRPALIRQRLDACVRGGAALPAEFVSFLRAFLPHRSFVQSMTLAALSDIFEVYAVLVGRNELLMALLVDEREEIHSYAVAQAQIKVSAPSDEEKQAASVLCASFIEDRFLKRAGIRLEFDDETEPEDESPAWCDPLLAPNIEELEAENLSLQQTVTRLKKQLQEEKERARKKQEQHLAQGREARNGGATCRCKERGDRAFRTGSPPRSRVGPGAAEDTGSHSNRD